MLSIERKKQYIEWYKLAQEAVGDEDIIPKLSEDHIVGFVTDNDWLIVPRKGEIKRDQSKNRDDGNI